MPGLGGSLPIVKSQCETRRLYSDSRPIRRPSTSWLSGWARRLFPPRHSHPDVKWHNKGRQKTSHLTVNGVVDLDRTVYWNKEQGLSLIHISEPTRLGMISYAVFCLKK